MCRNLFLEETPCGVILISNVDSGCLWEVRSPVFFMISWLFCYSVFKVIICFTQCLPFKFRGHQFYFYYKNICKIVFFLEIVFHVQIFLLLNEKDVLLSFNLSEKLWFVRLLIAQISQLLCFSPTEPSAADRQMTYLPWKHGSWLKL